MTNCPICVGEQLTVEFLEPKTLIVLKVKGQVIWRQFHGDSSPQAEALFTAGIKFLNLDDSSLTELISCLRLLQTADMVPPLSLEMIETLRGVIHTDSEECVYF